MENEDSPTNCEVFMSVTIYFFLLGVLIMMMLYMISNLSKTEKHKVSAKQNDSTTFNGVSIIAK